MNDRHVENPAILIQWVTSDVEVHTVKPGITSLICEECEKSTATLVCEEDHEVLCPKCCLLLYPRTSTGALHPFYMGHKIRAVHAGDKSGTIVHHAPQISDEELTEERWVALGRDLSKPSAVEAPLINFLNATSKSNRPVPKFIEGDIVVFDVEDQLPSEVQSGTRLPPWRNREIWGRIMGTSHPRQGQYGHAVRDGDEHEPHYRVRCERWVKVTAPRGDTEKHYWKENGDDKGRATGKLTVYETEISAQKAVDKHRAALEEKKKKAIRSMGDAAAPFVLERQLAWVRDRQIKECLDMRRFPEPEIDMGYQADPTLFPTVILMPESLLFAPAEARAALVRRRSAQCIFVLEIVDNWLYEKRLIYSFLRWISGISVIIDEERFNAARVIQQFVRDQRQEALYKVMLAARSQREWEEKRKLHNKFHYLETEEERANGFTTDGKHYFATLHECEMYTNLWQEMGARIMNYIHRQFHRDQATAWGRWRAFITEQMKLESVPVTHYDDFFDVNKLLQETEDARLREMSIQEARQKEGSDTPWHPALGVQDLPALPRMWAWRNAVGEKVVEQHQKHNSYLAMMAGPTDTARWVIPGRIMAGAYPEGKARRRGRQPTPSSTIGQALINGIGTFVILMTRQELKDLEQFGGYPPLEEALKKEHGAISSMLTATVVKQQTIAMLAGKEVKRCRQYPTNDLRHAGAKAARKELVAKERMAFGAMERAKYALSQFPESVEVLHFPIPDGDVPDRAELLKLLEAVELRLRRKRGVYLQSRLGHGRASLVGACLLGRLYGIRVTEVLERIQSAHDAQVSVRNSGKKFSAPQTVQQVQMIRDILAVNETMYGPSTHKLGAPTSKNDMVVVYPKTRGSGIPLSLPPVQRRNIIEDQSLNVGNSLEPIDTDKDMENRPNAVEFRPPDFDKNSEAKRRSKDYILPSLHCPVKSTMRSLRAVSVAQEEKEKGAITMKLRLTEVGR